MLRGLSSYYYKEPTLLLLVRLAQGLVHLGKGLLTLAPSRADGTLVSRAPPHHLLQQHCMPWPGSCRAGLASVTAAAGLEMCQLPAFIVTVEESDAKPNGLHQSGVGKLGVTSSAAHEPREAPKPLCCSAASLLPKSLQLAAVWLLWRLIGNVRFHACMIEVTPSCMRVQMWRWQASWWSCMRAWT